MLKIEIKDNEELKTHNPALNSDAKGFPKMVPGLES
jgi:hypothetical protein